MNFDPDPELEQFRIDIRRFIAEKAPPHFAARNPSIYHSSREDIAHWTRILHDAGWSAPNWPAEYGGTGWSLAKQSIFAEECYLANVPRTNVQGFLMVGPVIYTFGTAAQKERYLGPILRGEEFWTQGFSEPSAGSDLASLKTRAVRQGDVYAVNGQKTWTSSAQQADQIFCLVRTAQTERPQQGISFLLVDIKTPGITVRPIHSIDDGHGLNEVFFDDVRVPAENLVGEENKGWDYAKFLLGNERSGSAAELPYTKKSLARLKALALAPQPDGSRLIDNKDFALRVARIDAEVTALDFGIVRLMGSQEGANPALASVIKIRGSELQQTISELLLETLGEYGALFHPDWTASARADLPGPEHGRGIAGDYFFRRASTIYGGSNEIQRNIIAKRLLGL